MKWLGKVFGSSKENSQPHESAQPPDINAVTSALDEILAECFEQSYELEYLEETSTFFITVHDDELAETIQHAKDGYQEFIDAWNSISASFTALGNSFYETAKAIGNDDLHVILHVLSGGEELIEAILIHDGEVHSNALE